MRHTTKQANEIDHTLTARARQRLPRPYAGFEEFLQPLLSLYEARGAQMQIDGLDPDTLVEQLRAYRLRAADEAAAALALQQVKDERLQGSSAVWSAMLEIYARAKVFARTDPTMKQHIAEFERFLKPRAPKRKATAH